MASKTDSKGNPIVTPEMIKKAGFTNLRDYLNDKRGLTRRDGKAAERTPEFTAAKATRDASNARARATSVKQQMATDAAAKATRDASNARARATSVKQQMATDAAAKATRDAAAASKPVPKARYGEATVRKGSK